MSKPRTRSQGPPDVDSREEDQPSTAQRRMSRELVVKLETLRLLPARRSEGGETSQLQEQTATKTVRPDSVTLRPPSMIPPASRPNSAMGIQTPREVSTKFSKYHVVPMHNSTAEYGKQNHITGLVQPRPEDMDEIDLEVAEIVEGTASNRNTSKLRIGEATPDRSLFCTSQRPNYPVMDGQSTTDNIHNLTHMVKEIPSGWSQQPNRQCG